MRPEIAISLGLPPELRAQAAAIYWQAFGGKLGQVMGPDARAQAFLIRVMRSDHVLVARDETGALLGLAGFKTPQGSFAGGSWADMRAIYGLTGLLWRAPLLALLSREVDNDRFLLDGICVAPAARGLGVGSALMAAIEDEARARGYAYVRLDVIESNWRARALYERLGYMGIKTVPLGLLRHAFGFDAAVTMVKPV
ncbi:GNAT family N-acetyltransferase [Tabrizicola sp.]|uniref:GNAT family N-acetyltransferase n=1 Tax=Tabrizicola sp. TaxID=2005166 RepID=UPI003D2A88C3